MQLPEPSHLTAFITTLATALSLSPSEELVVTIRRQPLRDAMRFQEAVVTSVHCESVVPASTPDVTSHADAFSPLESALGRARHVASVSPEEAATTKAWSNRLSYSAREFERARRAGVMRHVRRGTTRGHNGLVIPVEDVVRYLEAVHAIEEGELAAPRWYALVRRAR